MASRWRSASAPSRSLRAALEAVKYARALLNRARRAGSRSTIHPVRSPLRQSAFEKSLRTVTPSNCAAVIDGVVHLVGGERHAARRAEIAQRPQLFGANHSAGRIVRGVDQHERG